MKASRRYRQAAKALGLRIRRLREKRGWTLERASEQMKVDLKHLQKVEAAQINLTLVTLVRIADGFEMSLAALFTKEKP